MQTNYQGSTHKNPDTSELVWQIANKAQDLQLQEFMPNWEGNASSRAVPDLYAFGRERLASSSLATFNKKICELIEGKDIVDEDDDLPLPDFETLESGNEDNEGAELEEFV